MRPIILITLHRRYHEFCKNVLHIEKHKRFFKIRPIIYVIWADPEHGKLWLFEDLINKKIIDKVITRKKLPNENGKNPTSFFESQNIRIGLENIFRDFPDSYCIVQAADIKISENGFEVIEKEMLSGSSAVTFIWDNRFTFDSWATNCFAVSSNRRFWPPIIEYDALDVLERHWFKEFALRNKRDQVTVLGNSSSCYFSHSHESESLAPFLEKFIEDSFELSLYIKGSQSWFKRLLSFLGV